MMGVVLMDPAELSVNEAFSSALQKSREVIVSLRRRRGELEPYVHTPKNGEHQVSVSSPGSTPLQAMFSLVRRLISLGHDEGEIVCLSRNAQFNFESIACRGLQAFWTKNGKEPPKVTYSTGTLEDALDLDPIAIVVAPEDAPNYSHEVPGYLCVTVPEPPVCFLLRAE